MKKFLYSIALILSLGLVSCTNENISSKDDNIDKPTNPDD